MMQLWPQLLLSLAEKALADIIAMDQEAKPRLKRLAGKQFAFQLQELKLRVVLTATDSTILLNQHQEPVDCAIQTDLVSLKRLRDPNQLTQLIKQDAVQIEGDLQVAQQFSGFFQQLQPDWSGKLASYVGDGMAHKVEVSLKQMTRVIASKAQQLDQLSTELLQDELQLTPHPLEVEQFSVDVSRLQAKVDRLQQQLTALQE